MSKMDDELTEILGDFSPDAGGDLEGWGGNVMLRKLQQTRPLLARQLALQPLAQQRFEQQRFGRHRRHRHGHGRGPGQSQWRGRPGAPGLPGGAAAAPAGQPSQGAIPIPPGNWAGGPYPPPGWSPGQALPGYPQGWPPPGSPWPGTFQPGISNVPQPAGVLTSYDPYGNPVFAQPGMPAGPQYNEYGEVIYPPGVPAPTIDVTVGEALEGGMKMTEIIGCLKGAGYSNREISSIVGRCCGW